MKSRIILSLISIILFTTSALAQPLPPSTPNGNPVPIGEFVSILLVAGTYFLVKKKKK